MQKPSFADTVDYNIYRDSYNKKFKSLSYSFPAITYLSFLVICLSLEIPTSLWFPSLIGPIIYWGLAGTFAEVNARRRPSIMYRTIWYPYCVFLIVFSLLSLLSYLGVFARYYALRTNDNLNHNLYYLLFLPPIIDFIGRCFVLHYCRQWLTLLRWEFEELNLTRSEKQSIQKEERTAYLQGKRQARQEQKEKRKAEMSNKKQKAKQNISNMKDNLAAKFDSIKTHINSQSAKSAPVSKLDKLNELKELYNNGVISDEEYQKARADILGK